MKIITKLMMLSAISFSSLMAMRSVENRSYKSNVYEEKREEAELKPIQILGFLHEKEQETNERLEKNIANIEKYEEILKTKKINGVRLLPTKAKKIEESREISYKNIKTLKQKLDSIELNTSEINEEWSRLRNTVEYLREKAGFEEGNEYYSTLLEAIQVESEDEIEQLAMQEMALMKLLEANNAEEIDLPEVEDITKTVIPGLRNQLNTSNIKGLAYKAMEIADGNSSEDLHSSRVSESRIPFYQINNKKIEEGAHRALGTEEEYDFLKKEERREFDPLGNSVYHPTELEIEYRTEKDNMERSTDSPRGSFSTPKE